MGYQNAVTRECLHLRNSPQEKQGVVFVQSVSYVFRGKWILLSLKMMVIHWNTFVFYFCIFENKTLLHAKGLKFQ